MALVSQAPCEVTLPTATSLCPTCLANRPLDADPTLRPWTNAGTARIVKDCSRKIDYPDLDTKVRGFWTDRSLYLLFACPYRSLNRFEPGPDGQDRDKLWDRDVVEVFLGTTGRTSATIASIEIAPTGERVDLAINLDGGGEGRAWNSGWETSRPDR